MRAWLAAGAMAVLLAGCGRDDAQARARAAAERVRQELSEESERALAQRLSPQQVRAVQEALLALHEYYGEIDGRLDPVTVNAVEAFQRRAGLEPDGLLSPETQHRLAAAAARVATATAADEVQAGGVNRSTPAM